MCAHTEIFFASVSIHSHVRLSVDEYSLAEIVSEFAGMVAIPNNECLKDLNTSSFCWKALGLVLQLHPSSFPHLAMLHFHYHVVSFRSFAR